MENPSVICTHHAGPQETLCRAQVDRIILSPEFDGTDREGRFLRYIVDETLAGNAARIKAYSIAIAVFGRKESFDPQTDPIVRIEAGRLRRALERYYLTAGAADTLVITIPKGHYVPTFSMRDLIPQPEVPEPAPLRAPPVVQKHRFLSRPIILLAAALVGLVAVGLVGIEQWQRPQRSAMPELPRVQVERFEVQGDAAAGADIAKGTQQEIITRLSRFRDLSVLAPVDEGAGNPATLSRYVLAGSVIPTSKGFRLRTSLVQQPDGAVLWSDTYDSDLTNTSLVQAQAEIADKVAMQLGQSYGVLVLADKEFKRTLSPEDWAAYSCVLSFNFLRAKLDAAMIPNLKECLEQTVRRFPDYSTAWALLSLNRIDELRSVFPNDPAASRAMLERAFSDARKAAALDPQNARALQAEMLALFWDKQFAQGQIIGDRALALNPNDTNLLAEYGYRLALFGDWPKGCAMLRKAFQQDQITMMYYNPGLSLCAYFEGNLADAVAQIRKTAATSHPLHLMVAAAIHAEAGNLVEADRFRTLLLSSSPALARNLRQEVSLRLGRPEDVEKFLTSLGKAGLT